MEEYQNKVQACLATIKHRVKSEKITYREIAEKLGVSELTIKRQINAKDISLSKILALCDTAGISFSETWDSLDHQKPKHSFFSKEQDIAFFNNPNLMSFFFELFLNNKTPEDIKLERKLTAASLHLYLRKLEELGLIQVSAQQKVLFKIKAPVGFASDSKIVRKEASQVLKGLGAKISAGEDLDHFFISKRFILSEELQLKMAEELLDIISKYAELSEKFFSSSNHEAFEVLTCGYKLPDRLYVGDITNLRKFN